LTGPLFIYTTRHPYALPPVYNAPKNLLSDGNNKKTTEEIFLFPFGIRQIN
jgi:hypothetical protein